MSRRDEKPEIWLVKDRYEVCDAKTGEPIAYYTYDGAHADEVLRKDADLATLEDLVELCDHDAENVNAHDYVAAHRLLAAVLYRKLGREKATEIMRDIADRRGLHGMNGICGLRDSFADLNVGESGRDWDGKYGD